jgi:hypothetical protein
MLKVSAWLHCCTFGIIWFLFVLTGGACQCERGVWCGSCRGLLCAMLPGCPGKYSLCVEKAVFKSEVGP